MFIFDTFLTQKSEISGSNINFRFPRMCAYRDPQNLHFRPSFEQEIHVLSHVKSVGTFSWQTRKIDIFYKSRKNGLTVDRRPVDRGLETCQPGGPGYAHILL